MHFQFETRVRKTVSEVFQFFSNPENLHFVLRGVGSFKMLRHDGSVELGAQTWVETTVLGFLPIVLGFEHTEFVRDQSFSEKLIHGPFTCFDHRHEFLESDVGTVIRDTLVIQLPWQYGGSLGMSSVVSPLVHRMFNVREANTVRLLDGDRSDPAW